MSDPEWNGIVKRKLPVLVISIQIVGLLDHLLAEDIISTEDYEVLNNIVSRESQTTACRKLLVSILPRKLPGTFPRFLRVLQSIPEQRYVAELLMNAPQPGINAGPPLEGQGSRPAPGSRPSERAETAGYDIDLPPIARDILIRKLPEKLTRELANSLDNLSTIDLDWRGLFTYFQDRYNVFDTSDANLYKMQYKKIDGSPTYSFLQDVGNKTDATAEVLYNGLHDMEHRQACTLMHRYFTESGNNWEKDARNEPEVRTVSLDRPCHDVLAREKELEAIATNFTELQMSGVGHLFITGPPACGKTELSRQFAELVVQQWKAQDIKGYPRAVFMAGKVNGGSLEDFTESLLKMAQWIGCSIAADFAKNISNIGTKLTTLSKNVRYQMKSFKEWLLVIDDLTKSTYQETSNYWPMPGADDWGRGRVLITTNDRSIVPCSNSQVKELKLSHGLRPSESVCLLQLISKRENMDGAAQLADQLHNIPLSLASAANFVKEEGESWYNYMAQLDTNIQNDSEEILAATQRTYPRTLQAAIVRAVTKIMEGNEQLKSALCLIAVCSPQHPLPIVVAQEFLKTCHKQSSSGSRITIIQCNLFKVSEDNIRVHPATHEALNELWNSDTEREQTAAVVLKVLVHLEQHASKTQLLLLPHLLHILSHPLPHNEEMDSIAGDAWMLCRNGIDVLGSPCRVRGWQATDKDSLHQQQVCAETALQLYRKVLNEPHAKFVEAYLQLADIYKEMYQLDKALESAQAADEQAQLLPDTPLLRGQSLETLGRIQMDKGENDKAMELFEQSKDVYLTNSEHESLPVASLLTSIGRLYHDRGRNDLAKTNYEHSFKICVHVAEKEGVHSSPLLAAIFASLGRAYLEPNYVDAEKAIDLLQKSLRFRYHIYGSDHPVPALTRTALGRAYLVNQQPHVAEVELREALRIQRLMLPDNHPDKAITLNVLGNLQRQRGKWEEAVYLLQQSLDIHTTNFGHDHSDIGFWKNNLAMAMLGVGRAADALKLLLDALEIKRTQFGPHHIEVAITYGCISDAYKALGDMAKAAEYSDKHAEIMRQQTDNTMATALSQQI